MRHVSKEERERVRWLNGMMKRDIKQKPLHTYIHTLLQQANGKLLSISVCDSTVIREGQKLRERERERVVAADCWQVQLLASCSVR